MEIIQLTPWDLSLAAGLVLGLAGLSQHQGVGLGATMVIAAARTVVQLTLIGMVLKWLFAEVNPWWVATLATVMLIAATREVVVRQKQRFRGWRGYAIGSAAMFCSSFVVTWFALVAIIGPTPWYTPRYAIPLLGMLLGNTMNSIALGLDRLTSDALRERGAIEARLALGQTWREAIAPLRADALRTSMIPMINAMAAAGIVSLPGMMTGQILAGNPPVVAVQYQILVMFVITVGTGLGAMLAVGQAARGLFDERQRLRLDRLQVGGGRGQRK